MKLWSSSVWVGGVWFKGKSKDLALEGDYWATEHPPSIWMHLSHPFLPFTLSILSNLEQFFEDFININFFLFIKNFTFESTSWAKLFLLTLNWCTPDSKRARGGGWGGGEEGRGGEGEGKMSCPRWTQFSNNIYMRIYAPSKIIIHPNIWFENHYTNKLRMNLF